MSDSGESGGGVDAARPSPPRVRVTAWVASRPPVEPGTAPEAAVREAGAVYLRSLLRGQLRLAVGSLLAFLLVAGAFTVAIFVVARVDDPVVFGVPLSWLLQAYGYYPIILFFAVVFARSASRNERHFRVLTEHETGESVGAP